MMAGNAHALLGMRISNISDFNLPEWSPGDPEVNASINICIYTYDILPIGGYAITVSSPGGFKLVNGSSEIPYNLYWKNSTGAGLGTQLSNNVKLTGQTGGNILSSTCALTGPNAKLSIKILQSSMNQALGGVHKGEITLLLTPN